MPELTAITEVELAAFFSEQCLTPAPADTDIKRLLALSFDFLCALPWCPDAEIDQAKFIKAQAYLVWAMTEAGGGFNPLSIQSGEQLKRRNIGRTAIEKEWFARPDNLNGTSPIYLLRQLSMPYGLLINWLCPELEEATSTAASCTGGPYVF